MAKDPKDCKDIFEYFESLTIEDIKATEKELGIRPEWDGWYWVDEDGHPKKELEEDLRCFILVEEDDETYIREDYWFTPQRKFVNYGNDGVIAWKPFDIEKPNREYRRSVSEPSIIDHEDYPRWGYYEWGECLSENNNQGRPNGDAGHSWIEGVDDV